MSIVSKKYLVAGIALATLTFAATLSPTHTVEAATCKQGVVEARGFAGSLSSARTKAWQNWQTKVANQFGLNWSVPQYATYTSEHCHHTTCVVKGKPCYHYPQ